MVTADLLACVAVGLLIAGAIGGCITSLAREEKGTVVCLLILLAGCLIGAGCYSWNENGHNTALDWGESSLVSMWAGKCEYTILGKQELVQYDEKGKTVTKYATLLMHKSWKKPRLFGLSQKLEFQSFTVLRNKDGKVELSPNETAQRP